jgi:2-polyprenyl-3-methyl-5-hydroxy-6-metoxy-1,4-benzoquinol methylase
MSSEYTRANDFDRRCGGIQTLKAIELGIGKSVLDLGCGVGEFTPLFLSRFERVVGIDPSEEFIDQARSAYLPIDYIVGWGETFELEEKFDTISMNNLLEHVDDPVKLLMNCKRHLNPGGVIIAQVPNAGSITRRLGVIMGIIPSLDDISDKERDLYGHKRCYNLISLVAEAAKAGLKLVDAGGILYKPLPNSDLEKLCLEKGEDWTQKFIDALAEFGNGRPGECAYIYMVCR